jgi:pyruvate/2-oxoglutarate/acetoin dehydrogenase E1 component/TPP-dependent pyruvate/acetoin dehydrogenase alpha subunit
MSKPELTKALSFEDFKNEVLFDYKIAFTSRECSLLGRKEVLTGKAKFGIFGDGKEVPQLAMAKAFQKGDFRSGYYRDQTFMMALGLLTPRQFFAGLYGHADINFDPMSGGRQMGGHFATHSLDDEGEWKDLVNQYNSSSDISPTAGQMPRLLGLAQASKVYRAVEGLEGFSKFSQNGDEVAWGTIGNASTSEGVFFETINAAGVLQVPMVICIWDDEYGISVPAKHQTTKENISEILKGFQRDENHDGYEMFQVKGSDYASLINVFEQASEIARQEHVPVFIHVTELTQPQGHSTSGSHERYKSQERLQWEKENDCNLKFREWAIANSIVTEEELNELEKEIKKEVLQAKKDALESFIGPIREERQELINILNVSSDSQIKKMVDDLLKIKDVSRKDVLVTAKKSLRSIENKTTLSQWIVNYIEKIQPKYSKFLYSESLNKVSNIKEVLPVYDGESVFVDGRVLLKENFDVIFSKRPEALVFGEDAGNIGDVNQGLEGLQEKFGQMRVADSGIREATIIGQGIGMAMRGLRPIAEIQYLDYLLYALQILSDDLATLHHRTCGKQKAPLIIRTRGHRLEGIWHAGSPMGMIIHALRGINVLVPRNMTKAAGFYNTLLDGDEPALVIECLNGYRLKEQLPSNIGEFKTPIGIAERLQDGTDITIVSYGSTLRLVQQAAEELKLIGISCEIIDCQSLIPFDLTKICVESLKKTNRLLVVDEDVPGGASAYIMQQIIEYQGGYDFLDAQPATLTAKPHRALYGSDGDYFSKPSIEDIFEKVYAIMHESHPDRYPKLY